MAEQSRKRVYQITRYDFRERRLTFLGYCIAPTSKQALDDYASYKRLDESQRRGLRVGRDTFGVVRDAFEVRMIIEDYRHKMWELGSC
mgnify:CR=1 FL=1